MKHRLLSDLPEKPDTPPKKFRIYQARLLDTSAHQPSALRSPLAGGIETPSGLRLWRSLWSEAVGLIQEIAQVRP